MANNFSGGIRAGSTSVSLPIVLRKTADGTESTGKAASDMVAYYWRQGGTPTAISLSDLSTITDSYSSGGVKEADSTHMPGTYRLDLPNAAIATGADWVVISVKVSSDFVFYERFDLDAGVTAVASGAISDTSFTMTSNPASAPSDTAPLALLQWLCYRMGIHKVDKDSSKIQVYKANGSTVMTTNTISSSGSTDTVGAAS